MTAAGRLGWIADVQREDVAAAVSRREKRYIWLLVGTWALIPAVRRIVEWRVGSHSLAFINLLPMFLMLPIFWQALRRHRFGADMNFITGAWAVALGYGLYIAVVTKNYEGGLYDLSLSLVPLFAALWIINASLNRVELFEILARASLTFATIISLYGLYQYAAPPPWDVQWVNASDLVSIGNAAPFSLRVFSTLNSPAVFATFLVFALLSSLHRLRWRCAWLLLPMLICTAALLLTLVRADYLAFALGIAVYFVCCSHRRELFGVGLVFTVLVAFGGGFGLTALYGSNSGAANNTVTDRLTSLNDVQNDPSALDRERQSEDATRQAIAEPLGSGLGTVGTSAQLSTTSQTFTLDNGYLSRWLELGMVGFPAYLIAVFGALFFTIRRWLNLRRARAGSAELDMLATSIAAQIAIIGAEIAGDAHSQLSGVYFWFLVGLSLKGAMVDLRVRVPWTLKRRPSRYAASGQTA